MLGGGAGRCSDEPEAGDPFRESKAYIALGGIADNQGPIACFGNRGPFVPSRWATASNRAADMIMHET